MPQSSKGTEEDVVYVPNIPFISALPNVKELGFIAELGFRGIHFATRPKEFQAIDIAKYFFGYKDEFTNAIEKIKYDFNSEDVGILGINRHHDKIYNVLVNYLYLFSTTKRKNQKVDDNSYRNWRRQ